MSLILQELGIVVAMQQPNPNLVTGVLDDNEVGFFRAFGESGRSIDSREKMRTGEFKLTRLQGRKNYCPLTTTV